MAIETTVEVDNDAVAEAMTKAQQRDQDLLALAQWLEDWLATARAVIVRREDRIRIGIAHRKARKSPVVATPPTAPAPAAPVVAPTTPPVVTMLLSADDRSPDSRAA